MDFLKSKFFFQDYRLHFLGPYENKVVVFLIRCTHYLRLFGEFICNYRLKKTHEHHFKAKNKLKCYKNCNQ